MLRYLAKFASVLKDNGKLLEASEVLVYLIQHGRFEDLYALVTEVVILTMQQKHPEDFVTARVYLESYALNLDSDTCVLDALTLQFEADKVDQFAQDITEIELDPSLTFNHLRKFTVELDKLVAIAKDAVTLGSKLTDPSESVFYRYYFFLLVALTKPERGFMFNGIDYEYQVLEVALERLGQEMNKIDEDNEAFYPSLNDYQLRAHFFTGLWNLAQIRTEHEVKVELDFFKPLDNEFDYVTVVNLLKERQ